MPLYFIKTYTVSKCLIKQHAICNAEFCATVKQVLRILPESLCYCVLSVWTVKTLTFYRLGLSNHGRSLNTFWRELQNEVSCCFFSQGCLCQPAKLDLNMKLWRILLSARLWGALRICSVNLVHKFLSLSATASLNWHDAVSHLGKQGYLLTSCLNWNNLYFLAAFST
jgi:hypothetical protein